MKLEAGSWKLPVLTRSTLRLCGLPARLHCRSPILKISFGPSGDGRQPIPLELEASFEDLKQLHGMPRQIRLHRTPVGSATVDIDKSVVVGELPGAEEMTGAGQNFRILSKR